MNDEWFSFAACKDTADVTVFFPDGREHDNRRKEREAKAICAACIVRDECLTFALETGQRFGIWGGTTQEQRKQIWRQRRWRSVA